MEEHNPTITSAHGTGSRKRDGGEVHGGKIYTLLYYLNLYQQACNIPAI